MDTYNSVNVFIKFATIFTIICGTSILITLISRRYLKAIFEHVDSMLKMVNDIKYFKMSQITDKGGKTYGFFKRIFDIIFGLTCLLSSIPLMVIIALLIKLSTPGPVIFKQGRLGKGGKVFYTYKFRTMREYTIENKLTKDETFLLQKDPRVTRIGRFLRGTGLDELPKFLNVLLGHMSITGTSCAVDYSYIDNLTQDIRDAILSTKPGLVSLWGLSGFRWRYDLDTRIPLDLYYVSHQSLAMDFSMVLMTIPSVLGRAGAY